LDESYHHLLIKRSCKTDGENRDGLRAGVEPDIFIWGGHWRGQFCNKGSCQWSV